MTHHQNNCNGQMMPASQHPVSSVMLIVDNIPVLHKIQRILESTTTVTIAAEQYSNEPLAIDELDAIDCVVLELTEERLAKQLALGRRVRTCSNAKLLVITSCSDKDKVIDACMECFASAFLFERELYILPAELAALRRGLTPQECMFHTLFEQRLTYAERYVMRNILDPSVELYAKPHTIRNQRAKIYQKLGCSGKQELLHLFHSFRAVPELSENKR